DIEYSAGVIAADGQVGRAESVNGQALGDGQLSAGQRDGLAHQAVVEDNRVSTGGRGDFRAQRAGSVVVVVHDRQRAGQPAVFEGFNARAKDGPFPSILVRLTAHTRTGAFSVPQAGREPHDASPFESWSAIE